MDIVTYGWEASLPSLAATPQVDAALAATEPFPADDDLLFLTSVA